MKKIYRLKIPGSPKAWIGEDLMPVFKKEEAVPVTFDQHIWVMENLPAGTIAYDEASLEAQETLKKVWRPM